MILHYAELQLQMQTQSNTGNRVTVIRLISDPKLLKTEIIGKLPTASLMDVIKQGIVIQTVLQIGNAGQDNTKHVKNVLVDSAESVLVHQHRSHCSNTTLNLQTHSTMSLTGKIALITGASKGIGRATALRLANDGASVVVNYMSDANGAHEVVNQIGSDRAVAIQADASKVSAITDLVEQTIARFGKIDILLPFAGMMAPSPLESTSEELFDKMFALNVKGPYFLCQVCYLSSPFFALPSVCTLPKAHISPFLESGALLICGLAHSARVHDARCRLHSAAALSPLPSDQGRNRADDARHVQRSRAERGQRELRCSGAHQHEAIHGPPNRTESEDVGGPESKREDRAAGGGGGCDFAAVWK